MARIVPFAVFLFLTFGQGSLGPESAYWVYFTKTLIGIWLLFEMRPFVAEMRWAFSWPAVVVGVTVFAAWVGISGEWTTQNSLWVNLGISKPPKIKPEIWNPIAQFADNPMLAWLFILTRIVGSTVVVPPMEEAFYRSFLYRYIARTDFMSVPLNKYFSVPFVATAAVFGFAHNEWLAGLFCGAAYQWLVLRRGKLGEAMTAHAITNFLLGVWVVWRGDWKFW